MLSKGRNNILLIVLACVSAGVLGYLMWVFLEPPPSAPLPTEKVSTDVQSGVVEGQGFRALQPYAALPIVPANVGRPNPFIPLQTADSGGNVNGDGNSNTINNLINNVNGGL